MSSNRPPGKLEAAQRRSGPDYFVLTVQRGQAGGAGGAAEWHRKKCNSQRGSELRLQRGFCPWEEGTHWYSPQSHTEQPAFGFFFPFQSTEVLQLAQAGTDNTAQVSRCPAQTRSPGPAMQTQEAADLSSLRYRSVPGWVCTADLPVYSSSTRNRFCSPHFVLQGEKSRQGLILGSGNSR